VLPALLALSIAQSGPRTIGVVGFDFRFSRGPSFSRVLDASYVPVDPVFRVGRFVAPRIAVGAELGLSRLLLRVGRFGYGGTALTFGPTLQYDFESRARSIAPYLALSAAYSYAPGAFPGLYGLQARVAGGVSARLWRAVGPAVELGWLHERLWGVNWEPQPLTGNSITLGLRLQDRAEP